MRNPFKPMIKYFTQDMKLRSKFIITNLILMFIPTVVMIIVLSIQLSDILTSNYIYTEQELLSQTTTNLENTLTNVIDINNNICNNNFLANVANYPCTSDYSRLFSAYNANELSELSTYINNSIDHNIISAIKVYFADDYEYLLDSSFYFDSAIYDKLNTVQNSYWHGIFAGTKTTSLMCPEFYLTTGERASLGNYAYIKRINTPGTFDEAIYIAIYFTDSSIGSTLTTNNSEESQIVSYIINSRNTMVATSNSALSGKYLLDYETAISHSMASKIFTTVADSSENYYAGAQKIVGSDWYLITVIPISTVSDITNNLVFNFIKTYLIFVVIALLVSILISQSMAKRIRLVIEKIKLAKTGRPKKLEIEAGNDEIGDLIETYNYMAEEMNQLLEKQTQDAKDLRKSEFNALQAQINPHFLYNTLDMINWMAIKGQVDDISDAVQSLSRFYKLTLSKGNNVVNVRDELEHVSLYVKLQNMRFKNNINFIIDVPDELLDYKIPKLIMQPIVENSILHGIMEKESKSGNIVIMGWAEEEYLVFIISDDGIGMSEDTIKQIFNPNKPKDSSGNGSNIGVYNTHKRLMLYQNSDEGLIYNSTLGKGTEVEFHIAKNSEY